MPRDSRDTDACDRIAVLNQQLAGLYRVLAPLGKGGMGVVYLAESIRRGRLEALKVLRPEHVADRELFMRFRREARAASRLRNRHIVRFYDLGRLPDEQLYCAMEYAEGVSVARLLDRGPLSVPRSVHILAQLARAVQHAHELQVIHRDLKPENMILVNEDGDRDVLKVLDFGLAKIVAADYTESWRISLTGEVYGTVPYMSPEQITGESADPLIDVYAMGCVGYELLAGRPPFTGDAIAIARMHLHAPPPRVSELNPAAGVPGRLDELLLRCLAKQRAARVASAREFEDELRELTGYPEAV